MYGLDQQRQERIAKLATLRARGINPYPYRYTRTHSAADLHHNFSWLEGKRVSVPGRLMLLRHHGKSCFADLQDESGRIQLYLRQDQLDSTTWALVELLDPGDHIGVEGELFRTRMGEISIAVHALTLLAKSLHPLPDKWHGLKNRETRYRQRHIDLVVNPAVRDIFILRTRICKTIRSVLDAKGFLEVETPILQPLYGGASARPFTTHYNALDATYYLRIANELYLKRLIGGGFEAVYEIAKDFRNEGMDRTHNPEFTQVEFYWAYRDYFDMMNVIEEIFVTIARSHLGTLMTEWEGQSIDLIPPWPRRPMLELVAEQTGIAVPSLDDEALRTAAAQLLYAYQTGTRTPARTGASERIARLQASLPTLSRGALITELFDLAVEPLLSGPIFVTDYPVEISPLAKIHRADPRLTERFELYIGGREMANSFSELNDPLDQRHRFEAQQRLHEAGDEEAQPLDEDFLRAMEFGMPPMGGAGIGIDRLTMFFANQASIQEVIFFPHLRPEPPHAG